MERQNFIILLRSKDETIAQFKSIVSSLEKVLAADAVERKRITTMDVAKVEILENRTDFAGLQRSSSLNERKDVYLPANCQQLAW